MSTFVLKNVKSEEIPKLWQKRLKAIPNKIYDITITLKEISPLSKNRLTLSNKEELARKEFFYWVDEKIKEKNIIE